MKIEQLTLQNFRNVRQSTFRPSPHVNFLVGQNGQGKTSFIEAIGYLSLLRSFRESKTPSVIQWGTTESQISCLLSKEDPVNSVWQTRLKIEFHLTEPQKATKLAYINDKPYRSSTDYLTQRFKMNELGFHSIIFNPSDHDLIRGEPGIRRNYLDRVISAESDHYLRTLKKYQRILQQRNSILKNQQPKDPLYLSFTEQLCATGAELALERLKWIQRVNQVLSSTLEQIAPNQAKIRLIYDSSWVFCANSREDLVKIGKISNNNNELDSIHFTGQPSVPSLELLERSFWTKVSAIEAAEWKVGHSLVGPHRDDWTVHFGDKPLKGHGSQGEVRSTLLALKLSEIKLFQDVTGHRPIFLLDDFSSELDAERRLFLLQFLVKTDLQTFVTTTEGSYIGEKHYWVSNGAIEEGSHDNRRETIRLG